MFTQFKPFSISTLSISRHGHQYTPKDNFGVDCGYNIINPQENAPVGHNL